MFSAITSLCATTGRHVTDPSQKAAGKPPRHPIFPNIGHFGANLGQFGQIWVILGEYGHIYGIFFLGHFRSFCYFWRFFPPLWQCLFFLGLSSHFLGRFGLMGFCFNQVLTISSPLRNQLLGTTTHSNDPPLDFLHTQQSDSQIA